MSTQDGEKPEAKEVWWHMMLRPPALYVLIAFGIWWLFVIVSGQQLFPVMRWDFAATGQLGDSFGIISALMTSMAAIFTYQTLSDTREQAKEARAQADTQRIQAEDARAEAEAERQRVRSREVSQDAAEAIRDAEQTYFRLLDLRLSVLTDVSIKDHGRIRIGTDGAEALINQMKMYPLAGETKEQQYLNISNSNNNDLGHYFRLTYHIVGFADENFRFSRAYKMVRLLRAQLSNAEIVLIALNCAYAGGRGQFKTWVEKYSLLHNVDEEDRVYFELDRLFKKSAFERKAPVRSRNGSGAEKTSEA